jgi:hypothetical protein
MSISLCTQVISIVSMILIIVYGYVEILLTWFAIFQLSTIWAETADNARVAARMYMLGGLSEKYHGISNFWLSDRINVRVLSQALFSHPDSC